MPARRRFSSRSRGPEPKVTERPVPTRFSRSGWLEGLGGLLELIEPVYYLGRGIIAVVVFVAQIFGD